MRFGAATIVVYFTANKPIGRFFPGRRSSPCGVWYVAFGSRPEAVAQTGQHTHTQSMFAAFASSCVDVRKKKGAHINAADDIPIILITDNSDK